MIHSEVCCAYLLESSCARRGGDLPDDDVTVRHRPSTVGELVMLRNRCCSLRRSVPLSGHTVISSSSVREATGKRESVCGAPRAAGDPSQGVASAHNSRGQSGPRDRRRRRCNQGRTGPFFQVWKVPGIQAICVPRARRKIGVFRPQKRRLYAAFTALLDSIRQPDNNTLLYRTMSTPQSLMPFLFFSPLFATLTPFPFVLYY